MALHQVAFWFQLLKISGLMRIFLIAYCLYSSLLFGQKAESYYNLLNKDANWQQKLVDSATGNWRNKWFLDGLRAEVLNTSEGMEFKAGPIENDHTCHAVLWTKDSFKGDIKIEYEYTRTDTLQSQVNILYIQATGIAPFNKDISLWNKEREIPYMKTYFNNMKLLHISYAAFNDTKEYIRVRKYPCKPNEDFAPSTEIPPAVYNTGLFKPGITYSITVIKTDNKLYFKVVGKDIKKLLTWELPSNHGITEGRVGLRHMYTRSARYRNFKIHTK